MRRFNSNFTLGKTMGEFSQDEVKNEPMLFNCDMETAERLGGPITRDFVSHLDPEFRKHGVIDTRVHMLMPGWFPCIPGWHHDDVPRSTQDGQPNYTDPEYRSRHCLALVNGAICPTELLVGHIEVPDPVPGRVIYKDWDNYLEGPGRGQGERVSAPDRSFHRGTQAIRSGWRWFGRVSIDTDRKPSNEIRKQVQVYLGVVNSGW